MIEKNSKLWDECFKDWGEYAYSNTTFGNLIDIYCAFLQNKAEAYNRLMSEDGKTLKDIANLFQMCAAIDSDGYARLFSDTPFIDGDRWNSNFPEEEYPIPGIVHCTGDWKNSLTMPDKWVGK